LFLPLPVFTFVIVSNEWQKPFPVPILGNSALDRLTHCYCQAYTKKDLAKEAEQD